MPSSPTPFSQAWEKGSLKPFSPRPALGEGNTRGEGNPKDLGTFQKSSESFCTAPESFCTVAESLCNTDTDFGGKLDRVQLRILSQIRATITPPLLDEILTSRWYKLIPLVLSEL
jgi:hypothetical protein